MNLDKALDIIKKYEKCRLESYKDDVGIWTCGWGTVNCSDGSKVDDKTKWTQERCDAELLHHVEDTSQRIIDLCYPVELNENQHNALVSLVYNIGIGNFRGSTILKHIHIPNVYRNESIADQFLDWNKGRVDGKLVVLDGLTKRREEERSLFLS